jgi:hypothetical protein
MGTLSESRLANRSGLRPRRLSMAEERTTKIRNEETAFRYRLGIASRAFSSGGFTCRNEKSRPKS